MYFCSPRTFLLTHIDTHTDLCIYVVRPSYIRPYRSEGVQDIVYLGHPGPRSPRHDECESTRMCGGPVEQVNT